MSDPFRPDLVTAAAQAIEEVSDLRNKIVKASGEVVDLRQKLARATALTQA